MPKPKISVVIPYRARLANLRLALRALAEQTLRRDEFEVVVGVMEYSVEYIRLCREFAGRLKIVSVLDDSDWNVSRARNLAIRQARGDVMVLLDADMLLAPHMLESIWRKYFAEGGTVCVLGRAFGYTGKTETSEFETLPYEHHQAAMAAMAAAGTQSGSDTRWQEGAQPLPWSVCWGGLVALPMAVVRQHDLTFDEGFRGWGAEDVEWGYRVHQAGTPIVLGEQIHGLHLPHVRDISSNFTAFDVNKYRFLVKTPTLEVELFRVFGWPECSRIYFDVRDETAAAAGGPGRRLGIVRGKSLVVVGVSLDVDDLAIAESVQQLFDPEVEVALEILPIVGMGLPYPAQSITECVVLPSIMQLSPRYRDRVLAETARVAVTTRTPDLSPAVG